MPPHQGRDAVALARSWQQQQLQQRQLQQLQQQRSDGVGIGPGLPRIFYHARTAVRMSESELAAILRDPASVPDSDDDDDDFDAAAAGARTTTTTTAMSESRAAWAAALRSRMARSLAPQVRLAEREVMFNWTAFVRDRPLLVDSHVPLRAFEFCREHGERLLLGGGGGGSGEGAGGAKHAPDSDAADDEEAAAAKTNRALRRRALSLHLLTLFEHGLIDGGCMRACLAEVDRAARALDERKEEEEKEEEEKQEKEEEEEEEKEEAETFSLQARKWQRHERSTWH